MNTDTGEIVEESQIKKEEKSKFVRIPQKQAQKIIKMSPAQRLRWFYNSQRLEQEQSNRTDRNRARAKLQRKSRKKNRA